MQKLFTIQDYLDTAKVVSSLKSDELLAELIGVHKSTLSQIRAGKHLPNDEVMIRLIKLTVPSNYSGLERAIFEGLANLNMWRLPKTFDTPEARKAYAAMRAFFEEQNAARSAEVKKIYRAINKTAAALVFAFVFAGFLAVPAEASGGHAPAITVYYGKYNILVFR